MNTELKDGTIVRDKDTGKMYVISKGKKRWILTLEAAAQLHLNLDQYQEFSHEELRKVPVGGTVVDYPEKLETCESSLAARAFLARNLTGAGIECGPGSDSNCYPVPLSVNIKYLDRFDSNSGCNQDYEGEFPVIDYQTTINKMEGVQDESLDFIVHCHVIEHSRNPLQALEKSYQKLKPGGFLIMAVPDKEVTFDKPRALTKVRHLINDYKIGVKTERDLKHVHCCRKICVGSEHKLVPDLTDDEIRSYLDQDIIDLHWHTYTDKSFLKFLKKSQKIVPWRNMQVIPRTIFEKSDQFIEFYAVLQK